MEEIELKSACWLKMKNDSDGQVPELPLPTYTIYWA